MNCERLSQKRRITIGCENGRAECLQSRMFFQDILRIEKRSVLVIQVIKHFARLSSYELFAKKQIFNSFYFK